VLGVLKREGEGFADDRAQLIDAAAAMIIKEGEAALPLGQGGREKRQYRIVASPLRAEKWMAAPTRQRRPWRSS
jgi:hypothetical protein